MRYRQSFLQIVSVLAVLLLCFISKDVFAQESIDTTAIQLTIPEDTVKAIRLDIRPSTMFKRSVDLNKSEWEKNNKWRLPEVKMPQELYDPATMLLIWKDKPDFLKKARKNPEQLFYEQINKDVIAALEKDPNAVKDKNRLKNDLINKSGAFAPVTRVLLFALAQQFNALDAFLHGSMMEASIVPRSYYATDTMEERLFNNSKYDQDYKKLYETYLLILEGVYNRPVEFDNGQGLDIDN